MTNGVTDIVIHIQYTYKYTYTYTHIHIHTYIYIYHPHIRTCMACDCGEFASCLDGVTWPSVTFCGPLPLRNCFNCPAQHNCHVFIHYCSIKSIDQPKFKNLKKTCYFLLSSKFSSMELWKISAAP